MVGGWYSNNRLSSLGGEQQEEEEDGGHNYFPSLTSLNLENNDIKVGDSRRRASSHLSSPSHALRPLSVCLAVCIMHHACNRCCRLGCAACPG